ncbi:60S ribosomal protein L4 [Camellia lanceoleosa]|uniref:60S ribosomal protein L4 n=1 Tax=Camellia lanceoleosa TaxID=1840588 RepID=A0ACC0FVL8_9ERIC|nr:60S ribosomal protein L4 [Camellia lanceoleosa]
MAIFTFHILSMSSSFEHSSSESEQSSSSSSSSDETQTTLKMKVIPDPPASWHPPGSLPTTSRSGSTSHGSVSAVARTILYVPIISYGLKTWYVVQSCLILDPCLIIEVAKTAIIHAKEEEATKSKSAGKAWYLTMISDIDYTEFENFSKWLGVSQ